MPKLTHIKQFVTSLSAAALLMKSTHRNMFAYPLLIIFGKVQIIGRQNANYLLEQIASPFSI